MKNLVLFLLCCFPLTLVGQQTMAVPVIVQSQGNAPDSLSVSDLKGEVNHQPVSVLSLASLKDAHLQYVVI